MSKGGSTTSEVKLPEYIEAAAQRNLNRADRLSQIGYVPEYGPSVAAFTPMQQAAFQNTGAAADAFGMSSPTSQRDIMGGMDAPTSYANGVQGYSSAPMYEQMVNELARNRPGQKSYIDSFSIDPSSGNYARQPTDYTQYNTMAQDARNAATAAQAEAAAQRGNDLDIALANNPSGYNTSTTSLATPMSYFPGGVNDPFLTSAPSQFIAGLSPPDGMTRQTDGSYTRQGSAAPTVSPRPAARPDGLGNTSTSNGFTDRMFGLPAGFGGIEKGNTSNAPSAAEIDLPGNVVSRALGIGAGKKDSSGNYGSAGGDGTGICVVATHAVESGAFTPHMKREAVVWCMDVLHGKWWGEAIRRGYRHCANKKIEQGKAREHYGEFLRYIAFANGKNRTLRGAVTFTLRTAQFFAVGIVKKDA